MINKKISTTLEAYMENTKDSIDVTKFRVEDFTDCLITDLLPQYIDTVSVSFNEEELRMYNHNPKKLAYDLYGSTDLAFLICDINDHSNSFEFSITGELLLPSNQMIQNLTTLYHSLNK